MPPPQSVGGPVPPSVPRAAGGFTFGPYQLDLRAKRLLRGAESVTLPGRQFELLAALVGNAGEVLSKDQLIKAAWGEVVVGDNSVEQAISQLRATLDPDKNAHIVTLVGRGYRFVAPVAPIDEDLTDAELDAIAAPHLVFLDGRAGLETFGLAAIARTRARFEHLLVRHGRKAGLHIGLANACLMQYDATRVDPDRDMNALQLALTHARTARRLDPQSAHAWATLGSALWRAAMPAEAVSSLRQAIELEPDDWRHFLRLGEATWGEERLGAGRRMLALKGECPIARWLIATVYVARSVLGEAERHIDAGLAAMPPEPTALMRFSAVALDLLKGLLCLARGDDEGARAAFDRELALEPLGHFLGRECCANTWYAIGASHLWRGEQAAAREGFEQALARVPSHPLARVGLAILMRGQASDSLSIDATTSVDLTLASAAMLVALGDAPGAAQRVAAALETAPPGNAGWLVPIEPLLGVQREPAAWTPVVAQLRRRAM